MINIKEYIFKNVTIMTLPVMELWDINYLIEQRNRSIEIFEKIQEFVREEELIEILEFLIQKCTWTAHFTAPKNYLYGEGGDYFEYDKFIELAECVLSVCENNLEEFIGDIDKLGIEKTLDSL